MGFYGRRMVPEPLLRLVEKLQKAGIDITEQDILDLTNGVLFNAVTAKESVSGKSFAELLMAKASLDGNNTFTGQNSFQNETDFYNDIIHNQGNLYVDFDHLLDKEDDDKTLNEKLNAKQDRLYQHNIVFSCVFDYDLGTERYMGGSCNILKRNNTPITANELKTYIETYGINGNFTGDNNSTNFYRIEYENNNYYAYYDYDNANDTFTTLTNITIESSSVIPL